MTVGLIRQGLRGRRSGRRRRQGCLLRRSLLLTHPLLELIRGPDIDDHRHEAMVAAAQSGALPAIDAFLARIDSEPEFIDETGNGRTLRAEVRHPPRMDHILRG